MKNENSKLNNQITPKSRRFSISTVVVGVCVLAFILFIASEQKDFKQRVAQEILIKEQKEKQAIASKKEEKNELIRAVSVSEKKSNFLKMIIPALDEVYEEELNYFNDIKTLVEENPDNTILDSLRNEYNAKDNLELLMALKPHPKSITLAQAAMESAWGESRFFKEANNLFGVWSYNKKEPRIAASSLRGEKTIWLKKYATVKDAIKDYYKMLSRSWAFKEFRALNYEKENQNPYLLVKKLKKYSEKRGVYTKELSSMINYNKFTNFDEVYYEREKKENKPKKELKIKQKLKDNTTMLEDSLTKNIEDVKKIEKAKMKEEN